MNKTLFSIIILLFLNFSAKSQTINYSDLTLTSETLKRNLFNNKLYFSGGNSELPYFQGKESGLYIKFYDAIGITVVIDFKTEAQYTKLITEITTKANFLFKYC